MDINEIIRIGEVANVEIIAALKKKTIDVPSWGSTRSREGLVAQYDPTLHPVMDKSKYPDVTAEDGSLEQVTRIPYDLQRLATKRMTELCNGIPVRRIYRPDNDRQADAAKYLESIFTNNRIDAVNIDRCKLRGDDARVCRAAADKHLWLRQQGKNPLCLLLPHAGR